MPHSIAFLTALSGLGATAAHTKADAGLEACFLRTSFADAGQVAANAAVTSPHLCAGPAFLKIAGKAACDFFSGVLSGVKVVTAGRPPDVCHSSGTVPGVSSAALWMGGAAKAVTTNITLAKASSARHASAQLLALKHHAMAEGASGGGHGLACGSFAGVHANAARDLSNAGTAASWGHTLPVASTTHVPIAAAAAATGNTLTPAAGGVATGMSGLAAKTSLIGKGAALSAQSKGMLLSKTALHGGHKAWKTRSSFYHKSTRASGSSRATARAQPQSEKLARQRQKQVERDQRKNEQQLARERQTQQKQMKREQRAQKRAQERAYRKERAESRRQYRMERDRLKQEQRQLRSLARNEERMQQEREKLAAARAQRRNWSPYDSSGPGPRETSRWGRRPYGGYGAGWSYGPYGEGMPYGGYGGGPGAPYGHYGGSYGYHEGPHGPPAMYPFADDYDYNDRSYYEGDSGYGPSEGYYGIYQGVHQGGYPTSPVGTVQRVYTQPGNAEGLKTVTVVQDIAETKGGVTLHHVTETTSRARNVVAPEEQEVYASCCFLPTLTSTALLRRALTDNVSGRKCKANALEGGEGWVGGGGAAAAADIIFESTRKTACSTPAVYGVFDKFDNVASAPSKASELSVATGHERRVSGALAQKQTNLSANGSTALHSIAEEDEDGVDYNVGGSEEQKLRDDTFSQIKQGRSVGFLHSSSSALLENSWSHCLSHCSDNFHRQKQWLQLHEGQQQRRVHAHSKERGAQHALLANAACSSRGCVIGIEAQHMYAEVMCLGTEPAGRVIQESSHIGLAFETMQEQENLKPSWESRHCRWQCLSEECGTKKEVCAARNSSQEQRIAFTTVSTKIFTGVRAAATNSGSRSAPHVQSSFEGKVASISVPGIIPPDAVSETTNCTVAAVANGTSGSIDESCTICKQRSTEGQSNVRGESLENAESTGATVCHIHLLRPDGADHVSTLDFGFRAASTNVVAYREEAIKLQANSQSVTAAGRTHSVAAKPNPSRSATQWNSIGLPCVRGRRVQLSVLPFRKLMYSNFI